MIPELPKSVDLETKVDFYSKLLGNLEDQSTVHVNWHTHRQNPSVCWICDMQILGQKILSLIEPFLSKSALDMGTESSSEYDSDTEIESDDVEEEEMLENINEPEYDVEEYER